MQISFGNGIAPVKPDFKTWLENFSYFIRIGDGISKKQADHHLLDRMFITDRENWLNTHNFRPYGFAVSI